MSKKKKSRYKTTNNLHNSKYSFTVSNTCGINKVQPLFRLTNILNVRKIAFQKVS